MRGFPTRGYFIPGRDGTGARWLAKKTCRRRATLAQALPGPCPAPHRQVQRMMTHCDKGVKDPHMGYFLLVRGGIRVGLYPLTLIKHYNLGFGLLKSSDPEYYICEAGLTCKASL